MVSRLYACELEIPTPYNKELNFAYIGVIIQVKEGFLLFKNNPFRYWQWTKDNNWKRQLMH